MLAPIAITSAATSIILAESMGYFMVLARRLNERARQKEEVRREQERQERNKQIKQHLADLEQAGELTKEARNAIEKRLFSG